MDCSLPGSSVQEDSPSKKAGGGCHALLLLLPSQLRDRNQTQVSHNAGRFFIVLCFSIREEKKKEEGRRKIIQLEFEGQLLLFFLY